MARGRPKKIIAPEAKPQNQSVEVGDFHRNDFDEDSPAHRNALRRAELKGQFISISDQVAQSNLFFRNYKLPLKVKIPVDHPDAQIVTKFYPHAKGGPLYVDEPIAAVTIDRAYLRQKILKSFGLRHIVIEKDSSLEHALEQLGEF